MEDDTRPVNEAQYAYVRLRVQEGAYLPQPNTYQNSD